MTRVLAFSDLHADAAMAVLLVAAARDADLVLGAGDFCNLRHGLSEVMALLSPMAAKAVYVAGNAESAGELRAATTALVLHGQGAAIADISLFGLGYGVPETPFGSWSCDLSEVAAADLLAAMDHADILISHSPPKGIADLAASGRSLGSTAIRAAIERVQPRYCLCGHIHDSWGVRGWIGATEVINLGPAPVWIEL